MTTVCFLFKKIVKIVICLPTKHLEFLWTCLNVSVLSRSNWNLEEIVLRRGYNWSTRRKTSWSKGENQQQTQTNDGFDARIWTRATLVGGECSHHCPTLAPLFTFCWSVSWGISMQWCHWLLLSIQGGGGGVFIVIGFGFPITWRIMQVLEGVMGLCPTAAILSQETKVALFYLSSLTPKFFTARLRLVKQNFFESLRTIWLAWK